MDERILIETALGRLAVRRLGSGRPAVLWHSLFVDERSWDRVAADLAVDRGLIVITGPGHGASDNPRRRYDLADCAAAAVEVLDHLGVALPVDWVGNAWGGHVGLRLAADHPHRLRSLVTIGTPVAALDVRERASTRLLLAVHRLRGPVDLIIDGITEALLSPATRAGDPAAVELVRRSVVDADPGALRHAVVCVSLRREDLRPLLPAIAAPTLMITSDQHVGWTPTQLRTAVTAMRDARATVVQDAAYLVPLEQPAAVVDAVRGFWASVSTPAREVQR